MMWLSPEERHARGLDSTRDRTVLINQVLLTGVAVLGAALAIFLGQIDESVVFVAGLALLFLATGAAIVVPWKRVPFWAAALVPVVDVIAIGALRDGAPAAALSLLWAFPAMWIGSSLGIIGVVTVTAAVSVVIAVQVAAGGESVTTGNVLLPVLIGALSTMSHLVARRAHAQRALLEEQAQHLRRSVDRARQQEDLVTEVLDAVDFGVIRITSDGQLVVTNEAHARLQGSIDPEAEGIAAFRADGVTPFAADERPLARARSGETFENELVWYGAPGEGRRALSVTARRLPDLAGSSGGIVVVSRDVTAEELAIRAREDLVASVSHELRTPLTSIIGYVELAIDDPALRPATKRDLEIVERNAERLLELVSDILSLSDVTRHGAPLVLHREEIDVAALVATAIEAEVPRAGERRIRVTASGDAPARAHVDRHRFRQVIDNLVTNAVKYNHDGGSVDAEVRLEGGHVVVTVRDDGPGISAEEQPHVFERFFRSDTVRNSTTHGSGLGLAITRDIVRAHGGDITLDSAPGAGTTFRVDIPATPPADVPPADGSAQIGDTTT